MDQIRDEVEKLAGRLEELYEAVRFDDSLDWGVVRSIRERCDGL